MPSSVIGNLRVNLLANVEQFNKEMQGAGASLKSFGTSTAKLGAGLTAAVTLPIVALGKTVVQAGMDAQEAESLFETSFGDMADSVRAWSNETSAALGTNAFEMRENTATLFTMFRSMGIGAEEARKMATELAVLTQDMASFRNLDPADAFRKIQAGITGSTEPLMALGINLKAANVNTVDLTKSQFANAEAVGEQRKVLRRFLSLMQQTTVDQGDLIRTQDSATNQFRRFKAQLEQVSVELGTALIPLVSRVAEGLLALVPHIQAGVKWFTDLSPSMQNIVVGGVALAAALGPLLIAFGALVAGIGAALPVIGSIATGLAALATGPIGLVVAAVAGLTVVWVKWGDDIKRIVADAFGVVDDWLGGRLGRIVQGVKGHLDSVVGFFADMKDTLVGNSIVPDMVEGIDKELDTMGESFEQMVSRLERESSRLNRLYEQTGNLIISNVVAAREALIESMVIEQATVIPLTEATIALSEATTASSLASFSFADTLRGTVSGAVEGAKTTLGGLGESFMGMFSPSGIISGIMSGGMTTITNLAMQGMQALGGVISSGLKAVGGFFRNLFGGPSAKELAGREIVENFQGNMDQILSDTQRIESGGELWRSTNIAVRDSYLEVGLSEQQAMDDVQALYDAIKAGPDAVNPALQRIQDRMAGLDAAIMNTSRAMDDLTRDRTVRVDFDVRAPELPDIGAIGMRHGGAGRVTGPALFAVERGVTEEFAFSGAGKRFGDTGGNSAALESRLGSIERLLRRQPEAIGKAVQDAAVLTQRS